MEFPNLGKNCTIEICNKLDFLPFQCTSCKKIFCSEHFQNHDCPFVLDNQVPICPLCSSPVASLPGNENEAVSIHIDSNCQSKEIYVNKCSFRSCKKRELVPFTCETCQKNFCLKHRHFDLHKCQNRDASDGHASTQAAQAAMRRAQETEDEQLAKAIQASMQDFSTPIQITGSSNDKNKCALS